MSDTVLKVVRLSENARLPHKGSLEAAGFDLFSAYEYSVAPASRCLIATDLQIKLPSGTYGRIAPRSGLALKRFIDIGAGVIDRDYRGTVKVLIFNFGQEMFYVQRGDRIAQLICEKIENPELLEVSNLDKTTRDVDGFGSTGAALNYAKSI